MPYQLGVDLGTTFTAAAVARGQTVQVINLGDHGACIPSVLFLTQDDTFLVGDAAERRALDDTSRVVREFKRRLGDPADLRPGGKRFSAEALTSQLLSWVVARVMEREDEAPERTVITFPAGWGAARREALDRAVRAAGIGRTALMTEPEAAATHYASLERVGVDAAIAVYDLGGGTFDAAIVCKEEDGFKLLGQAEGVEDAGGLDFDEALFWALVERLDSSGSAEGAIPRTTGADRRELLMLREEAVEAKEALSYDEEVRVSANWRGEVQQLAVTRDEFEDLISRKVDETIGALQSTLASAGLRSEDLDAVLLVGGSSRTPLVRRAVAALGRPVKVDVDPKLAVASGAALEASRWALRSPGAARGWRSRRGRVALGVGAVVAAAAAAVGVSVLRRDAGPALVVAPDGLAATSDAVYVLAGEAAARRLSRFEGASLDLLTDEVFPYSSLTALEAEGEDVRGAGERSARLFDTELVEVADTRAYVPRGVLEVAAGENGALWVLAQRGQDITVGMCQPLTPPCNRTSFRVPDARVRPALAAGAGAAWVVDGQGLRKVTSTQEQLNVQEVEFGERLPEDEELLDVAVSGEAVWLATSEGNVSRLDPESQLDPCEVEAGIELTDVVAGEGQVIVAAAEGGRAWRVDDRCESEAVTVEAEAGPKALALGDAEAWILNERTGILQRLPLTGPLDGGRQIDVGEQLEEAMSADS